MCESFQSAATGAATVITFARVSSPRPASRLTALEAAPLMVLPVGLRQAARRPILARLEARTDPRGRAAWRRRGSGVEGFCWAEELEMDPLIRDVQGTQADG